MNINPFDLLKNAQNIQQQFGKVQEELAQLTAEGTSGGGIVSVAVNGKMEIVSLKLDPIAVDPRDITMLQDLIIAAHRDALSKMKTMVTEKLGPMMGNLNIPGLSL